MLEPALGARSSRLIALYQHVYSLMVHMFMTLMRVSYHCHGGAVMICHDILLSTCYYSYAVRI